jgi:hypothetical protein
MRDLKIRRRARTNLSRSEACHQAIGLRRQGFKRGREAEMRLDFGWHVGRNPI